jgi:cellulose synthase/poly-beta-1,6-N-acetylglucosamine synthase-like glycosyltransferase
MELESTIQAIFWSCFGVLTYIYVGYPLVVTVLSRIAGDSTASVPYVTSVSVIIAAYNEEADLGKTIDNKLAQAYPLEDLELLVVSDGSTDGTDAIAASYGDRVRFMRQSPRAGKTAALNLAASQAKGEILVFADANSMYGKSTLSRLVSRFGDPRVGYVTGKLIYVNADGSPIGDGCSAYMRYENAVRVAESKLAGCIGVNGGVDAVRRILYEPMRPDQQPDFVLPLSVAGRGHRVVYEPEATLMEHSLAGAKNEYRMRVRVILRALWALFDMRGLLNPIRHGMLSFQIVSHKILRYTAFVPMAGMIVASAALAKDSRLFSAILGVQVVGYGVALLGLLGMGRSLQWLTRFPSYFLLLNVASAHAVWRFAMRQRQATWSPRTG